MDFLAYFLPKRGNAAEEYEDAFAGAPEEGRFAIADGASESSFARPWARLLVEEFVRAPAGESLNWEAWLPPLQERWAAEVGDGGSLPWYAEAKFEDGAFAAFLGLAVEGLPEWGRWHAVAVGDSCLFHVREAAFLEAFPVLRSEDFDSAPWLVGSRGAAGEVGEKKQSVAGGDCQAGDRFWLMTDALAQWFLREHEQGKAPQEAVERVLAEPTGDGASAFASWVEQLRDARALRNDDVTLVAICL